MKILSIPRISAIEYAYGVHPVLTEDIPVPIPSLHVRGKIIERCMQHSKNSLEADI